MNPVTLQARTESVMLEVLHEVEQAQRKFPGNRLLLAALVEEVGELARAIIEGGNWYEEAVHVACVAVRIATEGDSTHGLDGDQARVLAIKGRRAVSVIHDESVSLEAGGSR